MSGKAMTWWQSVPTAGRIVLAVIAAVVILGVIATSKQGGSTTAGTLSASACIRVVDAGREAANGQRSTTSFLGVLAGAEGDARSAADENSRYAPILEAIVSIRDGLTRGASVSAELSFLAGQCVR